MRLLALASAVLASVLSLGSATASHGTVAALMPRQAVANTTSAPRQGYGLKTDESTVTRTGISFGFHIDWIAGEQAQTLNHRLGKPTSIIGSYIHLNLTNQTYWEMEDVLPSVLPLAATTVYSPAVLPQFTLEQWTPEMSNTLAARMQALNAQGITVWLRFAYEMNGAWMDFGLDPSQYVRVWQEVATAVRAVAPTTHMLWAPNIHPSGATGINGYIPYYPGPEFVDMAGLSYYSLGLNQINNDLPAPNYFSNSFDTFYNLYAPAHQIVLAETSAPYHYQVPSQFASLPEDSELPGGGADGVDFSTLTPSTGTSPSELAQKSNWFEQLAGDEAAARYPQLLAIIWFNLAKIGGYRSTLRLNDYRAIKDPDNNLTVYFRQQIGSEANYQASLLPVTSASDGSSTTASGGAASSTTTTTTATRTGGAASLAPTGLAVGVLLAFLQLL